MRRQKTKLKKNARKKKALQPEWSVPELEALLLWAFSDIAESYKLKIEVDFSEEGKVMAKYKTLRLDGHFLPKIDGVKFPRAPDYHQILEESN